VLFLDELPEFAQKTRDVLRQPLEDKIVTIARGLALRTVDGQRDHIPALAPHDVLLQAVDGGRSRRSYRKIASSFYNQPRYARDNWAYLG
jgi:magnesium chelatase family protein